MRREVIGTYVNKVVMFGADNWYFSLEGWILRLLFSQTYDSNECWSSRLREAQNETKLSRQAQALEMDIY